MASSAQSRHGRLVGTFVTRVEIDMMVCKQKKIAAFQLEVPNVAWDLWAFVDPPRHGTIATKELTILQYNVTGSDRKQMVFTAVFSWRESPSSIGEVRVIGADGVAFQDSNVPDNIILRAYIHIRMYDTWPRRINVKDRGLVVDLDKLLRDGVLSDVVLQVQGGDQKQMQEFGAHKAVLAARSPVFQRLFQTDMAEAKTATVKVNFSVEVTALVLRYVYTDKVDLGGDAGNLAMDVLAAADYYQLEGLKDICEAVLLQRIGEIDVLATIVLADQCGAAKLKRAALDLAASNLKEMQKHPNWAPFLQDHRTLINELFTVLAEKQ